SLSFFYLLGTRRLRVSAPCPYTTLFRSFAVGERRLVDQIDFACEAGSVLAVVGPNGAGKSTLLRLLSGEVAPTSGQVSIEGRARSEEHTSELQSRENLVCRLLLEKKNNS